MALYDTIRSIGNRIMNTLTTTANHVGSTISTATNTTPDALKPILLISECERTNQQQVLTARAFYSGLHNSKLTTRLKEFLGTGVGDAAIRLNFTRKIPRVIAERLVIEGFDSTAADTEKAAQIDFANLVWNGSRMKGKRAKVHNETCRDGEYFILIDYDRENGRPRLTPHARYTDPQVSSDCLIGDGEGMWMKYPNDDVDMKPDYAVKRWSEQYTRDNGTVGTRQRINLYYEDRIEKYIHESTGWVPYFEANETNGIRDVWPVPWVDGNGDPLGIPVVHVKTPDLEPAAKEAVPIQKGLNKTFIDLLASSDANAFRILIALGWRPVDSAGNPLEIQPGVWVGTDKEGGSVQVVEGADLSNQIQVINELIARMADVTDTPLSLLNRSSQRAAEGTLQEEKESFFAKCRDYQETIELAYEDALKIARRIQNVFGNEQLNEEPEFKLVWKEINVRSIADKQMEAAAKLASGYTFPVIQRQVWNEDQATIDEMSNERDGMGDGFSPQVNDEENQTS